MAGDWIKWQKGLTRKPEVIQIAARLGLSRHAAAGLLMEVWEWTDDHVEIDETLSGSDTDTRPGSVRLGDSPTLLFDATFGVSGLADAMTAVGWMIVRSGSLVFPNFARHNGKSAKTRALDASRKRTARESGPPPVPILSGSQPDTNRTREEKSREEEQRHPPNPPPSGGGAEPSRSKTKPKTDEHPRFAEFWSVYPRKTARKHACAAFSRLDPDETTFAAMLAALARQRKSESWQRESGRFIPHPATWLNGSRWLDEETPPPAPPTSRPATAAYD